MQLTDKVVQRIQETVELALERIGAADIQKKTQLAVRFAWAQPAEEIILDEKAVTAVAVDIATVFSLEECCYQHVNDGGEVSTAERIQALSVVILEEDVRLCKSTYDAIGRDAFINAKYRTTSLDDLTETYIC